MTTPGGILVTGFAPFGGLDVNPSGLLAQRLARDPGVVAAVLPVSYVRATQTFIELVETHRPVAALCFGLAFKSDSVLIERIAWNRDESEQLDEDDELREDQEIVEDGPSAYGCSLPIPELLRALAMAGLPVAFSDHAGGFVCNNLFYNARHYIETQGLYLPMAFIHVPPLPEQVAEDRARFGLSMDRLETGVRGAVGWLRQGLSVVA
jgi:pyroglutamyl-peptidase